MSYNGVLLDAVVAISTRKYTIASASPNFKDDILLLLFFLNYILVFYTLNNNILQKQHYN